MIEFIQTPTGIDKMTRKIFLLLFIVMLSSKQLFALDAIRFRITSIRQTGERWQIGWKFEAHNPGNSEKLFLAQIEYSNKNGKIIYKDSVYNLRIDRLEKKMFDGISIIKSGVAEKITDINISLKK